MQFFRHYKGNYYCLIGHARHSETLEDLVVYQALYGERQLWVRPKSMFYEEVMLPDGSRVPRFAPCEEEEVQKAMVADASHRQLLDSLYNLFSDKGYTSEDFYGGCSLCGDANDFALDLIDEQLCQVRPELSDFDRHRLTSRLYNELHQRFEAEESL